MLLVKDEKQKLPLRFITRKMTPPFRVIIPISVVVGIHEASGCLINLLKLEK